MQKSGTAGRAIFLFGCTRFITEKIDSIVMTMRRSLSSSKSIHLMFRVIQWTKSGLSQAVAPTIAVIMAATAAASSPEHFRLLELTLTTSTDVIRGRIAAMDSEETCVYDRFGRLERIQTGQIRSFKVVSERFPAATAAEQRSQLRTEFAKDYEISVGSHYVVCGPKGKVNGYRSLFQDVYRSVERYYRVHGFRTSAPETPLVAVVFATQTEFAQYCRKDQVPWSAGLRGYYSLRSNRIIMFDSGIEPESRTSSLDGGVRLNPSFRNSSASLISGRQDVSATTASTIVHEATHQIGYNIGIHSRVTQTPTWVVEGLATVLEAPGVRNGGSNSAQKTELNSERLNWFQNQYRSRYRSGDMASLVATDEMFGSKTLDAYSLAWSLTYFLNENPARSQQFAGYLQAISARGPGKKYSATERISDFHAAFGDISQLEVELLRFMDRLPEISGAQTLAGR
jgi:hypothetical protein